MARNSTHARQRGVGRTRELPRRAVIACQSCRERKIKVPLPCPMEYPVLNSLTLLQCSGWPGPCHPCLWSRTSCDFDADKGRRLSYLKLQTILSSLLHIIKYTSFQELQHLIGTIRSDRPVVEVVKVFQDNIQTLSRDGYLDKKKMVSTELISLAFHRVHPQIPSAYTPPVADPSGLPTSYQQWTPSSAGGPIRIEDTIEATDVAVDGAFFEPGWDNVCHLPFQHSLHGRLPLDSGSAHGFEPSVGSIWDGTSCNSQYDAAWIPNISPDYPSSLCMPRLDPQA